MPNNLPRPTMHLHDAGLHYPDAWKQVDMFCASRGNNLPNWPVWCFLPMSATYAIVSGGRRLSPVMIGDVARLSALAAWRVTQGIYRIDPALLPRLLETPVNGDIPVAVLYQLPQWCVYVELGTPELSGFFAHLEWDVNHSRPELRLLLDTQDGILIPIPLHIGTHSLNECVALAVDQAKTHAATLGINLPHNTIATITQLIEPCVSVLLYLCSQPDQIDGKPTNPTPKRVKGGLRLFPPSRPTVWNVGAKVGGMLRAAYQAAEITVGYAMRPHLRRAHWHTYWTGSGANKTAVLRWLSPILVNSNRPA